MLIYDQDGRAYFNGERVPRVTEIVRLLAPRSWDVEEYFLRKGRLIHTIIQWRIESCLDESSVDPQLMSYLGAYQQFADDVPFFEVKKTEISFYSRKYGFCGRADIYAMFWHYMSVFDLKSGQPHEGDQYQTAMYLFGLKSVGLPCWRAFDLYLAKNGRYRLIEQKNPSIIFSKCLEGIKKWKEQNTGS